MRGKRQSDFIKERRDISVFLKDMSAALSRYSAINRQYRDSFYANQKAKDDALKAAEEAANNRIHQMEGELFYLERQSEEAPSEEKDAAVKRMQRAIQEEKSDYTQRSNAIKAEVTQEELDESKKRYAIVNLSRAHTIAANFSFKLNNSDSASVKQAEGMQERIRAQHRSMERQGGEIFLKAKTQFLYNVVAFRGYFALKDSLLAMKNPTKEAQAEIEKTLRCYRENMILNGVDSNLVGICEVMEDNSQERAKFEKSLVNYTVEEAENRFEEYLKKQNEGLHIVTADIETNKAQRLSALREFMNPAHLLYIPPMNGESVKESSFGQMLIDTGDPLFAGQIPGNPYKNETDKDFFKEPPAKEVRETCEIEWEKYEAEHLPPEKPKPIPDPEPQPPIEFFDPPDTYRRNDEGFMEKLPYPDGFFAKIKFFFTRVFGAESEAEMYNASMTTKLANRALRAEMAQKEVDARRKEANDLYDKQKKEYDARMKAEKERIFAPAKEIESKSPAEQEAAMRDLCKNLDEKYAVDADKVKAAEKEQKSAFFDEVERENEALAASLEEEIKGAPEAEEKIEEIAAPEKQEEIVLEAMD